MNKILSIVFLLLCQSGFCQWDRVGNMTVPISCGYFFDEQNGLIGSGYFGGLDYISNDQIKIWRTTNGGDTWLPCGVPFMEGRVTSIFMKDALVGYASIFSYSDALWKTTDGGKVWQDITNSNLVTHSCVYATSKSLITTSWSQSNIGSQTSGGFSTNDGLSFTHVFDNDYNEVNLNGIDFTDDNNGIVTPGPISVTNPRPRYTYYTNDGGLTWNRGALLNESWGIYAVKGTNTFVTIPEDNANANPKNRSLYYTTNLGRNWTQGASLPVNTEVTGHIAGKGNTIYVQNHRYSGATGLFRSDNLGTTWKNVGGPSNERDTRFVVTGCKGEVVFAFDRFGGIWRTTDGGDGTLSAGSGGNGLLSMSNDSILINTLYCQPEFGYVTLSVPPCVLFAVDSVYITSQQNEFSTDSTKKFTVNANSSVTVPVRFQYGSSATRKGVLHFKGTIGGRQIDTTVILIGKNATAPEPSLGSLSSVSAGDTTHIPIHLTPTVDTFTISRYRLHVSYNTDLLSCEDFDIIGTLSNPIISAEVKNDANGAEFICELRNPITEKSDLRLPVIRLVMRTYVTSTLETTIRLDTFSISSQAPLPLCTIPIKPFQAIKYECGDSMLVQLMRDGNIPEISYIKPNPVVGGAMTIGVKMANEIPVSFEIVDMQGKVVAKLPEKVFSQGQHEVHFDSMDLPSGSYIISLRVGSTVLASSKVSIQK